MNDSSLWQNGINTAWNFVNIKSRNNSRISGLDSTGGGSRWDSRSRQNKFKTIEPNSDYLRNNQTFNQPDTEKLSKFSSNKWGDLTSIQMPNAKLDIKLRPNAVGKVKLKPLKNNSAVINTIKNREWLNKNVKRDSSNDLSNLGNFQFWLLLFNALQSPILTVPV